MSYTERFLSSLIALISIFLRPILTASKGSMQIRQGNDYATEDLVVRAIDNAIWSLVPEAPWPALDWQRGTRLKTEGRRGGVEGEGRGLPADTMR